MDETTHRDFPVTLSRAQRKLEHWRRQHHRGARIAEELWAEAVELASEHGVNRIARALRNAADAGLSGRVRFEARDAARLPDGGPYDLVTAFETIHDMARPVDVLRAVRGALREDGAMLIADERVADTFTAPAAEIEQLVYGWSVLLPPGGDGRARPGRYRRGDAPGDPATLRGGGGLPVVRGPAHRLRAVALLPAAPVRRGRAGRGAGGGRAAGAGMRPSA